VDDAAKQAECLDGSFSIIDWSHYPEGLRKPEGPFRLLDEDQYEVARNAANKANAALRRADPESYVGKEIHEVHPVRFGGSPTDLANKVPLPTQFHRQEVTPWWNRLQSAVERLGGGE
jgi:filamentous hemagglutinin